MTFNGADLVGIYSSSQGYGNPVATAAAVTVSRNFAGRDFDLFTAFVSSDNMTSAYGMGDAINLLTALKGTDTHDVPQANFAPLKAENLGWSNLNLAVPLIAKGSYTYAAWLADPTTYDAVFVKTAQLINQYFPYAYIRLGHEFNGNYANAWSKPNSAWTSDSDYQACFRRAANILKTYAPNVKVVQNSLRGQNLVDPKTVYGGDDLVDVICQDPYDQYFKSYSSMADRWAKHVNYDVWEFWDCMNFCYQHGKTWAAPEWGVGGDATNGYMKDDTLYMRQMFNVFDFLRLSKMLEYQSYWDFHASDAYTAISQGTGAPKSATIYRDEMQPRATRLVGTGKPTVVQKVISKNGAVTLSNVTPGNVLVAVVLADETTGAKNLNNGFSANLVGLDMGTHRWRKTHGASSGNRGITAFHRTANKASDGVQFVPPTGWRGTVILMEVANFASLSIVPGTVVSSGGNISISAKLSGAPLTRGLAIVQLGASATPISVSQDRATTNDLALTTNDGGSNFYGAAMLELDGSPNTLALRAGQALSPLASVLLLNGRAAAPASSPPTIVQSANAAGRSAALPAKPQIGNTVLAVWCGDNNGGAGGTLPPAGWTEVMDAVPWTQYDSMCIAMLPVTDPDTQQAAAFIASSTAGRTTIMEISGNVSVSAVAGRPYVKLAGTDPNTPKNVAVPVNLDPTALSIGVANVNSTQSTSLSSMAGATSITTSQSTSSNGRAVQVFTMPSSLTELVITSPYGQYGGGVAVLTIKPN